MGLKDFMNEDRVVNRWFVVKIAIWGAFVGSLLSIAFITMFGLGWP